MRHQMLSNRTIPSRQSCEVKMVRQKLFAILVRAISVIYDHFSIEKVNLETSDTHQRSGANSFPTADGTESLPRALFNVTDYDHGDSKDLVLQIPRSETGIYML